MPELSVEQSEIWPNVPICAPEYYAGIMDGEGTLGIYSSICKKNGKRYWGTHCKVGMTSSVIVASFAVRFGGSVNVPTPDPGMKQMWIWQLRKRSEVRSFLSIVTPFLIEKRDQALITAKYLDDIQAYGSRSVNHLAYEVDLKEMKAA